MATKSYTDIPQSETLSKILSPESADMYWDYDVQKHEHYPMVMDDQFDDSCVRAWSLAALLSVLPEIQGGKPMIALDDNYITYPHINDLHTKADNLIDACVEMIIKLHEQNLL